MLVGVPRPRRNALTDGTSPCEEYALDGGYRMRTVGLRWSGKDPIGLACRLLIKGTNIDPDVTDVIVVFDEAIACRSYGSPLEG